LRMYRSHILGLMLVLAVALSACSPSGGSPSVASLESGFGSVQDGTDAIDGDTIAASEEAMLAFTQCLRDQGIDIGDPTVDADGNLQLPPIEFAAQSDGTDLEPQISEFEELVTPCEKLLAGIVATGSSQGAAEFEDALLEYAQCMRANGVDMPDPDLSPGGGVIDLGIEDPDDEAFAAADEQCREALARLGLTQVNG
jgi:hypothetical protein